MPLDDDKFAQFLGGWITSLPPEAKRIVVRSGSTGEAPLSAFDVTEHGREMIGGQIADLLQEFANTQGRAVRAVVFAETSPVGKARTVSVLRSLPLRVTPREETPASAPKDAASEAMGVLLRANESLQTHLKTVFEINNQSRDEILLNMRAILETDRARIKELAAEAATMKALAERAESIAQQAMAQATEVVAAAEAQNAQNGGGAGGGPDMRGMFMDLIKDFIKEKLGQEGFDDFWKAKEEAEGKSDSGSNAPPANGSNGASETPGAS